MFSYIVRRILLMIPLMFGITIVTFAVIHLAPGEPIDRMTDLNQKISAQAKQKLRRMYNLDRPLHV